MHVVGDVVRKSIQTNLSLILNSLLFKNIPDNPKCLSLPGIYSQLHNMLVGTISLSAGKDTKECNCKCNGHRKRKPICWFIRALDSQTDIFLLNYPGYVHNATSSEIIWNFITISLSHSLLYPWWNKKNKPFQEGILEPIQLLILLAKLREETECRLQSLWST